LAVRKKPKKVAEGDEVLEYLTAVVRGENPDAPEGAKLPDGKDRLRAAELLGKHLGLFSDRAKVPEGLPVCIVDDVDAD
jgi:phage terminase small subunit